MVSGIRSLHYEGDYKCEIDRDAQQILGIGYPDKLQECKMGPNGFMTFQDVDLGYQIDECNILPNGNPDYKIIDGSGSCLTKEVTWDPLKVVLNGEDYCLQYGMWVCDNPEVPLAYCYQHDESPLEPYPSATKTYIWKVTHFRCVDGNLVVISTDLPSGTASHGRCVGI